MKRIRWRIVGYLTLLTLALVLLIQLSNKSMQALMPVMLDLDFVGEYSIEGKEWKEWDEDTRLSSFEGELWLRGHFTEPFFDDMIINFYLEHIGLTVLVDGQVVYETGRARETLPEMVCGSYWSAWGCKGLGEQEEVEFHIYNPHGYGNANAYNRFMKSFCVGHEQILMSYLKEYTRPYWIAGVFFVVMSVVLVGIAIGYYVQRLQKYDLLISMGLVSFFTGVYILMDTIDICYRSYFSIFNTCVRQLCIMFGSMELVNCIRKTLCEKRREIATKILVALGIGNGVLLSTVLIGICGIYNIGFPWAILQGTVLIIMIWLCVSECTEKRNKEKKLLVSYSVLSIALLLEFVNAYTNFWTSGIVIKVLFILFFIYHLLHAVVAIAGNQRESEKAKELAEELKNSRIVLAMSQIKTHFIFNVLTAISGMCEYDPVKADETLVQFARYLRHNIDVMQEDGLEMFSKTLEHLEDYIQLEQVRFGDKIKFVKDLKVTEFKIPSLVLQPIVENSIKHGLCQKKDGGTIVIETWKDGTNVKIAILDDGVGYCVETEKEESVGLRNVEFRLKNMVDGRMEIESTEGIGTKVLITIPCKGVML